MTLWRRFLNRITPTPGATLGFGLLGLTTIFLLVLSAPPYVPRRWSETLPALCFYGFLTLLGVVRVRRAAADPRRRPGHCQECGYDLRATPDRCPECGTIPAQ